MILDHLSRAEKYYSVHPSFRRAFEFLKRTPLHSLSEGKHPIDGEDIYLVIARDDRGNERRKLEAHRRYIDIQLAVTGMFPLEWRDIDSCQNLAAEYDQEKDIMFYNDPPVFTVKLESDLFAVLFPEDVHAPQPPGSAIMKAIVKVAV